MPLVTTEAIVLRTIDYSETSLVVWLFSRDQGRLHLLAKGARRARSPFEGALEPLVRGELVYYQKKKSDALEIAKEFDPLDLHLGLRQSLGRLYRGLYVGELLLALSERGPDVDFGPAAYAAATLALGLLSRGEDGQLDPALFRCELTLLAAAGLAPRLSACAACDGAHERERLVFSPDQGGVLCHRHAGQASRRVPISRGALRTLLAIVKGQRVTVTPALRHQIRQLLDSFFTWHLERPLRLAGELARLEKSQTRA